MTVFYIIVHAAISAAFFTYFFYPLLAIAFFGFLWLLLPSRRPITSTLIRDFLEPAPEPLIGSMPVFILTFLWLFAIWIR